MPIIRHDHASVQQVRMMVVVQTTFERHGASGVRQDPPLECAGGPYMVLSRL
jgi:hypothetical protein